MVTILFSIINFVILFGIISLIIPKSWADRFWLVRIFWKHIGKPFLDRFLLRKVSVGRVVIEYFITLAAIFGSPICASVITAYVRGEEWLRIDFEQIGYGPIICAILMTVVLVLYIILNYKLKKAEQSSDNFLKQYATSNSNIEKLLSKYEASINKLHLKEAHSFLLEFREIVESKPNVEYKLLSRIDFLLAQCQRYGQFKDSTVKYKQAYQEMEKSKSFSLEIAAAYAYSLIKSGKLNEAEPICNKIHDRKPENIVYYVLLIANSDNIKSDFENLPDNIKDNPLFLSEAFPYIIKHYDDKIFEIDSYNYTIPSTLDFYNLDIWAFYISISANKLIKHEGYYFFGGEHNKKYIQEVFDVTSKYLSLSKETDVKGIFPDIEIFYTYSKFFIKDKVNFERNTDLEFMLSYKPSKGNTITYLMMTIEMLIIMEREEDAEKLLKKYANVKDESVIFLWVILAYRFNNVAYEDRALDLYTTNNYIIPLSHSIYVINAVIIFRDNITAKSIALKFENPSVQKIYDAVIDYIKNQNFNLKYLMQLASDCPKDFLFYIADILIQENHLDEALYILKPVINTNPPSNNLQAYIDVLRLKNDRLNLYHVLRDSRMKGIINRPDYLSMEFELALECNDTQDAYDVIKILYSKQPNDINILYNYSVSLLEKGQREEFEGLLTKIMSLPSIKKESLVIGFTNLLFRADHIEDGVKFLYKQISWNKTQILKDFYFKVSCMPSAMAYMSKSKDVVEDGDYVFYSENEDEKEDVVFCNSVLENLIGHKKGERILIQRFNELSTVTIEDIKSKYFALVKECIADIQRGNSKAGKMITLDELKGTNGDILGNLAKLTGAEANAKIEKDFEKRYSEGKASFLSESSIGNAFTECFNRIFGPKTIYALPYQYFSNLPLKDLDYILDLSSLLLLSSLTLKYMLEFDRKFIIPNGLKLYIERLIDQEKLETLSFIYKEAITSFGLAEKDSEPYSITILKYVKEWINSNCVTKVSEKMLKLKSDIPDWNKASFFHIEAESLLLTMDSPTVLLSEDWGLSKFLAKNFRTMPSIAMLILTDKITSVTPIQFLADIHFAGIQVSAEYMFQQYQDKIKKEPNSFDSCLEGLRVNPLLNNEGLKLSMMILHQKVILPQNISIVTRILTQIINGLPTTTMSLFREKIVLVNDKTLTHCYNEALKLSNVIITNN